MLHLRSVKSLTKEQLAGRRVILRLDLDVPIDDSGQVGETFRLERALPTLNYLIEAGARVLIIGHMGKDGTKSLEPVACWFESITPVAFLSDLPIAEDWGGKPVAVLENLRHWPGEKENDTDFATQLASWGEIYVNESFATSHRAHASIVGLPKLLPSYAGVGLVEEVENLSRAFNPGHPFLFILGGAKFETKIPLVEKFLEIADSIFISGALANTCYRARGYEIGQSVADEQTEMIKPLLSQSKIILPAEVVVSRGAERAVKPADQVLLEESIVDAGPASLKQLGSLVSDAKFVLWNGPLGFWEKGFRQGTDYVARAISESVAESVVGGGDTIASVKSLDLLDKFTFVSAGGGAMLDFLANGTLPGIQALETGR